MNDGPYAGTAAIALIGFGGPESMSEVRPFLESVLRGTRVPASRMEEVARHYERFHGRSPYRANTEKQRAALETWIRAHDRLLTVRTAYLHSKPGLDELFASLKAQGAQRLVAVVLSNFRSLASFGKYAARLEEARAAAGADAPEIRYTANLSAEPLFWEAQADRIRTALEGARPLPSDYFLFTAHSIPVKLSEESGYASQFETAARGIADRLGLAHWSTAYQSRSGSPHDPWLEPDVATRVAALHRSRVRRVLVVPVGFLCDNVEVLYDLDIEARGECERHGFEYARAGTVGAHPKFIELLGSLVLREL